MLRDPISPARAAALAATAAGLRAGLSFRINGVENDAAVLRAAERKERARGLPIEAWLDDLRLSRLDDGITLAGARVGLLDRLPDEVRTGLRIDVSRSVIVERAVGQEPAGWLGLKSESLCACRKHDQLPDTSHHGISQVITCAVA